MMYSVTFGQKDTFYDLHIKDTVIIEGCKDYAPFDFVDENGKYAGFDVDIMDALMKRMHLPYKYQQINVADIYKNKNKNDVDIISGITFSSNYRQSFSYGLPLLYVWRKIVSLKSHPIDCVDSLRGKKIAMRVENWKKDKDAPILSEAKEIIVEYDWNKILSLLLNGKVDAIIAGGYPIEYMARQMGVKHLHYANLSDKPLMQSFAVPVGNEELLFRLNEEFQMLKQDGTYEKIYNKWFGVYEKKEESKIPEIILPIFVLLALISLFYAMKYARMIRMHRVEMRLAFNAGKLTTFYYNPSKDKLYLLNVINGSKERKLSQKEFASKLIEKDRLSLEKANEYVLKENKDTNIRVRFKDDIPELGGRSLEFNLARSGKDFNSTIIIGTFKDVTGQVALEEKLEADKKNAEHANHMKSVFLANMSHDIRTPLNAIVGASELLTMDNDSIELSEEDRKEMFDMIKMNVATATTLVSDLLDITKIESGVYKIKITAVKLNMLCHVVIDSVRSRLNDGVEIKFAPAGDDDYVLNTDPVRLQQVLTNYMTNACKYTDKGHIELRYRIESGKIIFTVTDTGVGVPKDKAEVCFEMFNMLGSKVAGHGLGLYICRLTSNLMRGKVYVDTTYTDGARFVFEHPLDFELTFE